MTTVLNIFTNLQQKDNQRNLKSYFSTDAPFNSSSTAHASKLNKKSTTTNFSLSYHQNKIS